MATGYSGHACVTKNGTSLNPARTRNYTANPTYHCAITGSPRVVRMALTNNTVSTNSIQFQPNFDFNRKARNALQCMLDMYQRVRVKKARVIACNLGDNSGNVDMVQFSVCKYVVASSVPTTEIDPHLNPTGSTMLQYPGSSGEATRLQTNTWLKTVTDPPIIITNDTSAGRNANYALIEDQWVSSSAFYATSWRGLCVEFETTFNSTVNFLIHYFTQYWLEFDTPYMSDVIPRMQSLPEDQDALKVHGSHDNAKRQFDRLYNLHKDSHHVM